MAANADLPFTQLRDGDVLWFCIGTKKTGISLLSTFAVVGGIPIRSRNIK
jgi:hypothetical protein